MSLEITSPQDLMGVATIAASCAHAPLVITLPGGWRYACMAPPQKAVTVSRIAEAQSAHSRQ